MSSASSPLRWILDVALNFFTQAVSPERQMIATGRHQFRESPKDIPQLATGNGIEIQLSGYTRQLRSNFKVSKVCVPFANAARIYRRATKCEMCTKKSIRAETRNFEFLFSMSITSKPKIYTQDLSTIAPKNGLFADLHLTHFFYSHISPSLNMAVEFAPFPKRSYSSSIILYNARRANWRYFILKRRLILVNDAEQDAIPPPARVKGPAPAGQLIERVNRSRDQWKHS